MQKKAKFLLPNIMVLERHIKGELNSVLSYIFNKVINPAMIWGDLIIMGIMGKPNSVQQNILWN